MARPLIGRAAVTEITVRRTHGDDVVEVRFDPPFEGYDPKMFPIYATFYVPWGSGCRWASAMFPGIPINEEDSR